MSALKPIAITSLAGEAFGKLVQAITSGEFSPGQKLSESELARRLGISRGPLREALGRLEGRLVMRTPRLGVSVIDFNREDLEQLFFVREALEGMAARLAAERMTAPELAHLRDLLHHHASQPELAAGSAYHQRSRDEDYHFTIVRAARCERLEQMLLGCGPVPGQDAHSRRSASIARFSTRLRRAIRMPPRAPCATISGMRGSVPSRFWTRKSARPDRHHSEEPYTADRGSAPQWARSENC
jgi:DNA-binding GntR family transcriptional regulator